MADREIWRELPAHAGTERSVIVLPRRDSSVTAKRRQSILIEREYWRTPLTTRTGADRPATRPPTTADRQFGSAWQLGAAANIQTTREPVGASRCLGRRYVERRRDRARALRRQPATPSPRTS